MFPVYRGWQYTGQRAVHTVLAALFALLFWTAAEPAAFAPSQIPLLGEQQYNIRHSVHKPRLGCFNLRYQVQTQLLAAKSGPPIVTKDHGRAARDESQLSSQSEGFSVGRKYDPEVFQRFFATRPWLVAERMIRVVNSVLSMTILVSFDLLGGLGSWKEVLIGRADQISDAVARMGPTYNKFGQAISTRPDLIGTEFAIALASLQDDIPPFPFDQVYEIIRSEEGLDRGHVQEVLENLSVEPVAAGSIGQVHSSTLHGSKVAVKVLRPDLHQDMAADSVILRGGAHLLEALRNPFTSERIIRPRLVAAVDEFFWRLFEEADFQNEAANIERFAALYTGDGEAAIAGVVVPGVRREMSGRHVLTMEWVEGDKLMPGAVVDQSDLPLLKLGISCTLSQLLQTGVMHADPHPGNLLKTLTSPAQLVYLDFGLVSDVPQGVREGLVRAVAYLVARDYEALANLFSDLLLIPKEVLEDAETKRAFTAALAKAADALLPVPEDPSDVPELRFDRLIDSLAGLAPRFEFTLPPYFLNNARAIGTLEGMARSADPSFNVLAVVYGFAVQTLLTSDSTALIGTLKDITYDKDKRRIDIEKVRALVKQAASIAGVKRRQLVWDVVRKRQGRRIIRNMLKDAVVSKSSRMAGIPFRYDAPTDGGTIKPLP